MSQSQACPRCGAELPADAPLGLCPACVLEQGFGSQGGPARSADPAATSAYTRFAAPDPSELAPLFPQLEIIELVGQGGMGAVYKARQPGLDRLVALKILPRESAADPAFAERFTREARALAKLSHPNIVGVFDFGQAGGLYYFVMDFVDGLNLRRMIEVGTLDPATALAIVPQICQALQYAHDEGVVHRDIKPENILIDARGRVKIADFGLAKLLGRGADFTLTGTQQVMGTPHYMAPEQIERPQQVDHRADIYSLGVVFYEMLTGELPIGRFAPPSSRVRVDVRLDEVVLRSLEKEPGRRYQHASEVKTDVESIARQPRTLEHHSPQSASVLSNARQHGLQIVQGPADGLILAGCAALLTSLGVAVWLWFKWDEGLLTQLTKGNLVGASAGNAAYGLFMVTAGMLLRGLRARLFTLVCVVIVGIFFPAVIALNVIMELKNMPEWPVAIPLGLGVPISLWASVVLFRHDVRTAFQARPKPQTAPRPAVHATAQPTQFLMLGAGLLFGALIMTAGMALGIVALVTQSPNSQEFWGWMGGAFGCFFGGGGGLLGTWNSFRQMEGARDLMHEPNWTWFDWIIVGFGGLGVAFFVAAIAVYSQTTGTPETGGFERPAIYSLTLMGAIVTFQAVLFLAFRALARRSARQAGSSS